MKALVKSKREEGLWLEEVPVPEPGINDVLIEILRTGICGTDVHIYNWDAWAQKTVPVPLVIGHEFVGRIVEVGSNVKDFHPGDIVSGEGHVVCGRCRNCLAGRRHLCKDTQGVGVNRPGAYAEYLSLPMTNVWVHDPSIPRDVQAIFDPFGNAVHTALQFPVLGEDVLVTGAGPDRHHGRGGGPACRGAARGRHRRQSLPPGAGAAAGGHAGRRRPHELDRLGPGAAGHARRLRRRPGDVGQSAGLLRHAGQYVPRRQDRHARHSHHGMAIDWRTVIFNMLTIKGIYGREMYETWYKMTVMLAVGPEPQSHRHPPLPPHRFPKGLRRHALGQLGQGRSHLEGRLDRMSYDRVKKFLDEQIAEMRSRRAL